MLGINTSGSDPKKLKEVMVRENLPWRSFADPGQPGQGALAIQWNLTSTPTFYLLDHKGVIRHKWVGSPGAKVLDAALDPLIKEAEENGKNPPK